MIIESTELFAFSATREKMPPLVPTAPLTHPNKLEGTSPMGLASSMAATGVVSLSLLGGITGLQCNSKFVICRLLFHLKLNMTWVGEARRYLKEVG